ncbi:MAG: GNAT family N-acetyltransferase [Sphingobacterium composti]|uniref:GNAT family N-acetyltransferase n=1 Tax=Sphingobacterium composti TaxID=363260 RepID=UPI00135A167A|nr:GNAT family protein [Sphingobacterium composti Ten et al. 2007 non Yoo et al. 2007]
MNILLQININQDIELHQIQSKDAQDIFHTIDTQREYLGQWLPFVAYTKELKNTQDYVDSLVNASSEAFEYVFAIRYQNNFAGMIGFVNSNHPHKKTEIGYWLSELYQHRGIMTAAVRALCKFAFEDLHLNRIQIKCAIGNTASSNIPKRLGFVFEGIERQGEKFPDGSFKDLEIYSLIQGQFRSINQP